MNRGELTLEDCLVTGNEALDLGFTNSSGGGIASASTSAPAEFAVATIRNSAIVGNVAPIFGGIEFGNASSAHIENTTISGNSGQQVRIWRVDVVLEHVTISANAGVGLGAGSDTGTRTLEITNSAIQGTPACNLTSVLTTRSGHNASNDTSCGFSNAGDIEGVALGLAPLAPVGASQAHVPYLGSPLIDAADLSVCLSDDQVHTPRPFDGDSDGSSDCDLGAIELPEPGLGVLLASGALWLSGCLNLRRRTNGIHRVG